MDYKSAAHFWDGPDAKGPHMDRDRLLAIVTDFLQSHDTCALATGYGDYVRCTPIEYIYEEGYFYLFTEGGKKFRSLEHNKQVSIAVFEPFQGFSKLQSVQAMGHAEVVDPDCDRYDAIAAKKGLRRDVLAKRGTHLHILAIKVSEMDVIQSRFKEEGCFVRQHLAF